MADEPATPVAASPAISGPWAADIQALTSDPALQAAVDNFMRSKIQPRMTQLEQQVASAQTAQQLWDAFNNDPEGTYRALTAELYGAEAAEAMLAARTGQQPPAAPQVVQPAPPAQPTFDPTTMLSPDEVQAFRHRQELEAYDAAVDQILADPANADIDRDLYHTYVAAADGNFQEAVDRYRDGVARTLARYGIDPTSATVTQQHQAAQIAEADQRQAPTVMGSDAGGAGAPPPTQPEYRGMDGLRRAIDDTVAQMRRNAEAPPVS